MEWRRPFYLPRDIGRPYLYPNTPNSERHAKTGKTVTDLL